MTSVNNKTRFETDSHKKPNIVSTLLYNDFLKVPTKRQMTMLKAVFLFIFATTPKCFKHTQCYYI